VSVKKRRRALVTGGGVRVGRDIALALAAAGMDVVIGYHRSAGGARATVRDLRTLGARAAAVRADLADPAAARRLVAAAARFLGGLDVLVSNAALFIRTPLATTTPAQYDRLLAVNLRAPFFCAQAAARIMRAAGGHIVNVADAAWERAWPSYIPYAASKAGLVSLTRGLAAALAPRVAVNCVAPGAVLRPPGLPAHRWQALTRGVPVGPADVAAAVVFFATCPRGVTGEVLRVDGGRR
jgi:NAD(P)-dependent dehydrogenase (short-subunit alcohol dehydrogenase family)